MRRLLASLLVVLAPWMAQPGVEATPRRDGPPAPGRRSRSIGYPWEGSLRRAARLEESPRVRYLPEVREQDHFYGTWELEQLIERAAARVAGRIPGAPLTVGELSARRGGPIAGHRSHQNGRDADLAFYMLGPRGPFAPFAFARFGGDGAGREPNEMLRFDDDRNWELVAKLVADGDARVQHIFVARPLRRRLLRTGSRRRAPAAVLRRAAAVLGQPGHGHRHANHFHVRIYCAPADRSVCTDRGPFHPWYPGRPPRPD
ncbi:MAG: penicillin-insensitive murein endopeptidase [Sandaracinaceae bacterium]